MAYPNNQSDPRGAIPVWIAGGSTVGLPPGSTLIGYDQVTDLTSAATLNPPDGATIAVVQVNAGIVRYRPDGVDVENDVGMLAYATGPSMVFNAPFDDLSFIQATGSTGSLNILWYGPANA